MNYSLDQLDQKAVAVEFPVADEVRVLHGVGVYGHEPALGNCLRIVVDDSNAGRLEILLRESEWSGSIAVDDRHGCDYCVRLDPACLLH